MSNRDENPEIYVMNADGSDQKNLTNNPAQDSIQGDFYWSPDGTQILFHTDRDGNLEIYVMNADGSNPVNLSNNPASDVASIWIQ
jgi:TolB protein